MVPKSDERGSGDDALPEGDTLPGAESTHPEEVSPTDPAADTEDVPDLIHPDPAPSEDLAMPGDEVPVGETDDPSDPVIDSEPAPATLAADAEEAARDATDDAVREADDAAPESIFADTPVEEAPPPPPPPPVAAADVHEDHGDHGEEEGSSLAAKLLGALVLLIAGASLGIWAAPKIAPTLPAGMAPVADWLAPVSGEIETRIAAVEAQVGEVGSRLDTVAAERPDVAAAVETAVGASAARLQGEIDGLRDAIGSSGGDAISQRLAQLESALDGQRGELSALTAQLSGVGAPVSSLGTEAAARIDVYRAELDGLRAEFDRLSGEVGGLSGRLEEVSAKADQSITAAQAKVDEIEATAGARADAAEISADVAGIRAALASGEPFADEAERLEASGAVTLPDGLTAAAPTGAPSLPELQQGFTREAHAAIRAAILASAGDGFLARTRAYFQAQVASRSLTPTPGNTPDAVLSRMEDRLRNGDLEGVLKESEGLPSESIEAMSSWLDGVRARQAADAALATLGSSLPAAD